jgi:hypothetical protein
MKKKEGRPKRMLNWSTLELSRAKNRATIELNRAK